MNPPTTLIVAAATAMQPSTFATVPWSEPAATSEPTSEIPEIALVAAISGVCSVGETRPITSYPRKPARMRMNSSGKICAAVSGASVGPWAAANKRRACIE